MFIPQEISKVILSSFSFQTEGLKLSRSLEWSGSDVGISSAEFSNGVFHFSRKEGEVNNWIKIV